MKKDYINPTIEIIKVNNEDIIITSQEDILGGIMAGDNNQNWF